MADIVHLLSDHIANQIAAGEVIQRPASAVKELLENAIDAGATEIQLIIKDAGSALIQVVDNGKGMSPTDARMSFERHATSKIRSIDDLFSIQTMGFRGEALDSVAAVAQIEMKTRQESADAGTKIVIEGTDVKLQESCSMNTGTNIMVKNLFFNVPARRHFLKSPTTEYKHILDEFTRIALAFPEICFRVWHNDVEQFRLDSGSLKSRIIALLGNSFEKKLVPVEQITEVLTISGFIGKPETATKTRGNQFFFINGRYIRNMYLNHAVVQAYENLIEKGSFPLYVLFLEIDPARVDVNVHPTKQEVKFEDDRLLHSYLGAAVKHALASNNIAPSIDFTLNASITQLPAVYRPITNSDINQANQGYLHHVFSGQNQAHIIERNDSLKHWKDLFQIARQPQPDPSPIPHESELPKQPALSFPSASSTDTEGYPANNKLLIQGELLATTVKSGIMLINVNRAQERIWYDRMAQSNKNKDAASQKLLFPSSYEFTPQDTALLQHLIPEMTRIGMELSFMGNNTFAVQGLPPGLPDGEEKQIIDEILESAKNEGSGNPESYHNLLLLKISKRVSRGNQQIHLPEQQQIIIDELFASSQPEFAPDGKKIFTLIRKEDLDALLA